MTITEGDLLYEGDRNPEVRRAPRSQNSPSEAAFYLEVLRDLHIQTMREGANPGIQPKLGERTDNVLSYFGVDQSIPFELPDPSTQNTPPPSDVFADYEPNGARKFKLQADLLLAPMGLTYDGLIDLLTNEFGLTGVEMNYAWDLPALKTQTAEVDAPPQHYMGNPLVLPPPPPAPHVPPSNQTTYIPNMGQWPLTGRGDVTWGEDTNNPMGYLFGTVAGTAVNMLANSQNEYMLEAVGGLGIKWLGRGSKALARRMGINFSFLPEPKPTGLSGVGHVVMPKPKPQPRPKTAEEWAEAWAAGNTSDNIAIGPWKEKVPDQGFKELHDLPPIDFGDDIERVRGLPDPVEPSDQKPFDWDTDAADDFPDDLPPGTPAEEGWPAAGGPRSVENDPGWVSDFHPDYDDSWMTLADVAEIREVPPLGVTDEMLTDAVEKGMMNRANADALRAELRERKRIVLEELEESLAGSEPSDPPGVEGPPDTPSRAPHSGGFFDRDEVLSEFGDYPAAWDNALVREDRAMLLEGHPDAAGIIKRQQLADANIPFKPWRHEPDPSDYASQTQWDTARQEWQEDMWPEGLSDWDIVEWANDPQRIKDQVARVAERLDIEFAALGDDPTDELLEYWDLDEEVRDALFTIADNLKASLGKHAEGRNLIREVEEYLGITGTPEISEYNQFLLDNPDYDAGLMDAEARWDDPTLNPSEIWRAADDLEGPPGGMPERIPRPGENIHEGLIERYPQGYMPEDFVFNEPKVFDPDKSPIEKLVRDGEITRDQADALHEGLERVRTFLDEAGSPQQGLPDALIGYEEFADDPLFREFVELSDKTQLAEKDSILEPFTTEQEALIRAEPFDWEAFSRSRGYSEEEITDFRRWLEVEGELSAKYPDDPDFTFGIVYQVSLDSPSYNQRMRMRQEESLRRLEDFRAQLEGLPGASTTKDLFELKHGDLNVIPESMLPDNVGLSPSGQLGYFGIDDSGRTTWDEGGPWWPEADDDEILDFLGITHIDGVPRATPPDLLDSLRARFEGPPERSFQWPDYRGLQGGGHWPWRQPPDDWRGPHGLLGLAAVLSPEVIRWADRTNSSEHIDFMESNIALTAQGIMRANRSTGSEPIDGLDGGFRGQAHGLATEVGAGVVPIIGREDPDLLKGVSRDLRAQGINPSAVFANEIRRDMESGNAMIVGYKSQEDYELAMNRASRYGVIVDGPYWRRPTRKSVRPGKGTEWTRDHLKQLATAEHFYPDAGLRQGPRQ